MCVAAAPSHFLSGMAAVRRRLAMMAASTAITERQSAPCLRSDPRLRARCGAGNDLSRSRHGQRGRLAQQARTAMAFSAVAPPKAARLLPSVRAPDNAFDRVWFRERASFLAAALLNAAR